jgi:hypothetical protein
VDSSHGAIDENHLFIIAFPVTILKSKMMFSRQSITLLAFLILFGCSYPAKIESTPTPLLVLPEISTVAVPPLTPRPTIDPDDTNTPETSATSIFRTDVRPTLPPLEPTGMLGSVIQKIHFRSGPAQSYPSLGTLDYGNVLRLTGRDLQNLWYQFVYPEGPGGRAWAASSFIKVVNGDPLTLPLFDDSGRPIP